MVQDWLAGNQPLARQVVTVGAALAFCPANMLARSSALLGSLVVCLLSAVWVGHAKPEHSAIVEAAIELWGVVMLTLSLRWYGIGRRKTVRTEVNALSAKGAPDRPEPKTPVTDWRYAMMPLRPDDLAALMKRSGSDRRSEPRFRLQDIPGKLTVQGTALQQECILVDLSGRGGKLLTRGPLPIGSLVTLDMPDILLIGEVRHCECADGLYVSGVKFEAKIDRSKLRYITHGHPSDLPSKDPFARHQDGCGEETGEGSGAGLDVVGVIRRRAGNGRLQ